MSSACIVILHDPGTVDNGGIPVNVSLALRPAPS